VFKAPLTFVDGRPVAWVVPVSGQLDLKAMAAAVGGRKAARWSP
jgi:Cys-tRNA(Pro)/Cys-tRNA(Cys) deacylase